METYYDKVCKFSDEQYFNMLLKSINLPIVNGIKMPGFATEQIQRNFVGSSNEQTLREAYNFYTYVKETCKSLGRPITANSKILDFGCGWGRFIRFFLKDVKEENILGVDVDPEIINICQSSVGYGNFEVVNSQPPTNIETGSIDLIYAYSVFSHLSENTAINWVKEFSRILKNGGVLIATTERKAFLDYCESLHGREDELPWYKTLSEQITNTDESKKAYDAGIFVYYGTGGGGVRDKNFYGEALIPKQFVKNEFSKYLKYITFNDDPSNFPQAIFVMQKEKHIFRLFQK